MGDRPVSAWALMRRVHGKCAHREYTGHVSHGRNGGAAITFARASLPEVAAALVALTREAYPLARMTPDLTATYTAMLIDCEPALIAELVSIGCLPLLGAAPRVGHLASAVACWPRRILRRRLGAPVGMRQIQSWSLIAWRQRCLTAPSGSLDLIYGSA